MNDTTSPRRVLHLVLPGFPSERKRELLGQFSRTDEVVEIFELSEITAGEALEKIFAADAVAVWGDVTE